MTDKKRDDPESVEHRATEHEAKVKAAPKEAAPQAFPFTGSVNEPQTVSLPLPQGVEVPKPAITGYDPYECMIGDPDFTLVVSGDNFFGDSVINFAGNDEPTTFDATAKTLSTGVKPSLWAEPVVVQVMVKNGPEVSAPVEFSFLPIARSSTTRRK